MPRPQPKNLIFLVKTHTLTILLSASQTVDVAFLKQEALSALKSAVKDKVAGVPTVSKLADFELSRAVKERGKLTGKYELLDENVGIKGLLMNWDMLCIQYRDPETGELLPIAVKLPPVVEEEDDPHGRERGMPPPAIPQHAIAAGNKGKRKAPPE